MVFIAVYVGMLLGRFPGLQVDRTGIVLLGTIVLLATGAMDLEEAVQAIHMPTLVLLFALMLVSAQLRLGGFYTRVTQVLTALPLSPGLLLGALVLVVGLLAAIFSNDIVCLAIAPVLIGVCQRRGLDSVPFLLALACAANIGSAATLIGNPQNMLIGQALHLSFAVYLVGALLPTLLGLMVTWAVIAWPERYRWRLEQRQPLVDGVVAMPEDDVPTFDRWQTGKGLGIAIGLVGVFLIAPWRREIVALVGAGMLLMSRQMHSRRLLALVDWQLLLLFMGLFIVNHALQDTAIPDRLVQAVARAGVDLTQPHWLFGLTVIFSNAVSNVPAVMLFLPLASHPQAGPVLALSSTLAGNLLIVGSIANIIVVDAAAQRGIHIDWRRHSRTGIPVTVLTLAFAAGFLYLYRPAP
jgi:Na+/H+ antiporter NhaD/arsenite permease-like protein